MNEAMIDVLDDEDEDDEGVTLLVHYIHRDCPVNPGEEWDEENGPEYGACNSECPACHISDIEPVAWHALDLETCKHCEDDE